MKCIQAKGFGEIDEQLVLRTGVPIPERQKGELLLKVLACALAPGDVRVLSGATDRVQSPGTFPYIPGSDVSGIVEQVGEESSFQVGDRVVARFEAPKPRDGLAEYMSVCESRVAKMPETASALEAAALGSSGVAALLMSEYVRPGERVMVLGGSGGVGAHLVQLCKLRHASFIAATSTQVDLLSSLGVNRPVDYRKEEWWSLEEFRRAPLDVVFDLIGGDSWNKSKYSGVVKRGGRYYAAIPDNPWPVIHTVWDQVKIAVPIIARMLWSRLDWRVPTFSMLEATNPSPNDLSRLCEIVDKNLMRVVLDPSSPVPFTEQAVKEAFKLQKSRHGHGKIVVQITCEH